MTGGRAIQRASHPACCNRPSGVILSLFGVGRPAWLPGGRASAADGLVGARRMPSNGTFFSPRCDIPIPRRRYHLLSSTRSDDRAPLPCPVPPSILLSPEEDFRSLFAHGCSAGHNTYWHERMPGNLSSGTRWKLQRYSKLKFCGGIYCYNGGRARAIKKVTYRGT